MICDLIWPTLNKGKSKNILNKNLKSDFTLINTSLFKKNSHIVLDEARRLHDIEQERRNTADTKSAMYLTIVVALIAFFSSLTPTFEVSTPLILIFTFTISLIQLLRCGIWSLKALKVTGYAILDWRLLLNKTSGKQFESILIKEHLCSLRYNYDLNNNKVTKVNMSYATLISASFWLFIYMVAKIIMPLIINICHNENIYNNPIIYRACDFLLN